MASNDRDYKYLASRGAPEAASQEATNASRDYRARSALRNQWFAIAVAMLLFAAFVFFGIQSVMAGKTTNGMIVLGVFGAPLVLLIIVIMYRHYAWLFTIRNGAIESSHGIVGRDVQSIRVRDLRNVNVRQSFFQRLFGVGDIEFSSAGGTGIEVTFYGVLDPIGVKDRVQRASAADRGGKQDV